MIEPIANQSGRYVGEVKCDLLFDAVVGRFILQFVPDPVAALRSLAPLIRPNGVLAFQEVSYAPFLALSAHTMTHRRAMLRFTSWRFATS